MQLCVSRHFPFFLRVSQTTLLPHVYCSPEKLVSDWLDGGPEAARSLCYWTTPQTDKEWTENELVRQYGSVQLTSDISGIVLNLPNQKFCDR
jgi:hypothetical protein